MAMKPQRFLDETGGFFALMCLAVLPGALLGRVLQFLVEHAPLVVSGSGLGLSFCALLFLVWMIRSESAALALLKATHRGTRYSFVYSIFLIAVAVSIFAAFAALLVAHEVVQLKPAAGRELSVGSLQMLYLWHLLHVLIPIVDVAETLRWEEPFRYSDSGVGWTVLAFQLLVAIPVINSLRVWWKHRGRLAQAPP